MSMALWVLLSAATVAAFRTYLGFEQSLSGRYKIYCTLLLVFAYIYLADTARRHNRLSLSQKASLWKLAFGVSLAFFAAGMMNGTGFLKRRHNGLVMSRERYLADPLHNAPDDFPPPPPGRTDELGENFRLTPSRAIAAGILSSPGQ